MINGQKKCELSFRLVIFQYLSEKPTFLHELPNNLKKREKKFSINAPLQPVLRIRDVYPGSEFSTPESRICIKEFK